GAMRGCIAGLFVLCVAAARAFAQPEAPPDEPDFARATELYNAATQAMTEGRHDDAARDFLAAYEITSDPVLFFKIGSAYEKAGKCTEALGYYQRYLDEANPADEFIALTRERMDACKAVLAAPAEPAPAPTEPAPTEPPPPAAPAPA